MIIGGLQQIETNDRYIFPIDIINGLPYLKIHPFTDDGQDVLPKDIMTSDAHEDSKVMDNIIFNKENWYNAILDINHGIIDSLFDKFRKYKYFEPTSNQFVQINHLEIQYRDILNINKSVIDDKEFNQCKLDKLDLKVLPKIKPKKPNFELLYVRNHM